MSKKVFQRWNIRAFFGSLAHPNFPQESIPAKVFPIKRNNSSSQTIPKVSQYRLCPRLSHFAHSSGVHPNNPIPKRTIEPPRPWPLWLVGHNNHCHRLTNSRLRQSIRRRLPILYYCIMCMYPSLTVYYHLKSSPVVTAPLSRRREIDTNGEKLPVAGNSNCLLGAHNKCTQSEYVARSIFIRKFVFNLKVSLNSRNSVKDLSVACFVITMFVLVLLPYASGINKCERTCINYYLKKLIVVKLMLARS